MAHSLPFITKEKSDYCAMEEKIEGSNMESKAGSTKKSGINPKVFIIGLPLFIVQLVVVYFITANILLNKHTANQVSAAEENTSAGENKGENKTETPKESFGKFIYTMEDVIVNPTGTSGQRLMLASVNIDVVSDEQLKFLKEREPIVKDLIISTISSKTIAQLGQIGFKDTLKVELSGSIKSKFPSVKINDIYFSKYIMQ
jgi:flagellar FliL protein